uniref:type I protein arginine methyltransferase n=1 Tax=Lygus hesperus TaxID=30085 RepID=A0A0A9YRK5_LYGHE
MPTVNNMEQANGHLVEGDNIDEYFVSYEDLQVHQIMLTDRRRNLAYKNAIEDNLHEFKDKVVLDVGAGTGFLSVLCAQAGARKVYAVEASEGMIPLLKDTCRINNFEEVIQVVAGKVEDVELPEKVDVIISEWMGFYLIHEGMLSSVIHARDKFLQPGGVMVPNKSSIKACLCRVPSLYGSWDSVDGVNLSHVGKMYRRRYLTEPAILVLEESDLVSGQVTVAEFDLHSVTDADLVRISKEMVTVPKETCHAQGICLSFDVSMFGQTFSTGPSEPPTHWKQSVIVFPDGVEVEEGEGVAYRLIMTRTANPRRYAIELSPLEADEIEHEVGCECSMARCRIISAYIKEQERLDSEDNMETGEEEEN